jgi:hypothetical protein
LGNVCCCRAGNCRYHGNFELGGNIKLPSLSATEVQFRFVKNMFTDFSVVVQNRACLPKPWGWEIYRAGRNSPIDRSSALFETMTEANRAGKQALALLLTEFPE